MVLVVQGSSQQTDLVWAAVEPFHAWLRATEPKDAVVASQTWAGDEEAPSQAKPEARMAADAEAQASVEAAAEAAAEASAQRQREERRRDVAVRLAACPAARACVIDVLAGAPYEFDGTADIEALSELPALVARVVAVDRRSADEQDGVPQVAATALEADFIETVSHILEVGHNLSASQAAGHGLLQALSSRLAACWARCSNELPGESLPLTIDHSATSAGAATRSSVVHKALMSIGEVIGEASGAEELRARARRYRSWPPEVVLVGSTGAQDGPPVPTECFAFRGATGSVAVRIAAPEAVPKVVRYVVLEQPAPWSLPHLRSAPRRFEVFGDPTGEAQPVAGSSGDRARYSRPLGWFEYSLAAPRAQAFELKEALPLRGLQFVFDGRGEEAHTCIYRIRAYTELPGQWRGVGV